MGYRGPSLTLPFGDDADLKRCMREVVADVGDELRDATARFTPVDENRDEDDRDRPHLRDSWKRTRVRKRGHTFTVAVQTKVSYAPFVEYDTRPHIIRPKKSGGALRFMVGGRIVFAAYVRHPGTKGAFMAHKGQAYVRERLGVIAEPALERYRQRIETKARRHRGVR